MRGHKANAHPAELVDQLEAAGVQLWSADGELRFRAPRGALTDEHRAQLRELRPTLLEYLRDEVDASLLVAEPERAAEPFPLTDVQSAYLFGRSDSLDYGGVGCQVYLEADLAEVDPVRLSAAWHRVVERHPMLRAVVDERGFQQVRPQAGEYEIAVADLRSHEPARAEKAVAAVREELCHRTYEPGSWPMFDVRLSLTPGRSVLHLSFDLLVADFMSVQLLLDELHRLYHAPDEPLPALEVTFRDYLAAQQRLKERRGYDRARGYWWQRIDDLPPAPRLPTRPDPVRRGHADFHRWQTTLQPAQWRRLQDLTARHGLTPSGVVLGAYAETISRWTSQDAYTVVVTMLNRLAVHPSIDQVVGDFSSVDLLEVRPQARDTFAQGAQALQAQLWSDMDHMACSGVEVLRELGSRRGRAEALMPIVFTSAIALDSRESEFWRDATLAHGLTQTPQVWIDCQALVANGTLMVNWDVRDGVFPDGLIDDMFGAFEQLLHALADDADAWDRTALLPLPDAQRQRRRAANATEDPAIPAHRWLHEPVVRQAMRTPDQPAIAGPSHTLTYDELLRRAAGLAMELGHQDQPPAPIAVIADRGTAQVIGVLGVLLAGAPYLPIDTNQPALRRDRMLADAGVTTVVTQEHLRDAAWPEGLRVIAVDDLSKPPPDLDLASFAQASLSRPGPDLAYVIYTSGSTGSPKGVQISHRGALNTVEDMNRRFGVQAGDAILGLTNLGFDLSVYDIFGPLAVGGCLVLPDHHQRSLPSHWADLIAQHRVTLWNSVPAHLQMMTDFLATAPATDVSSLRLALLSGDWIPVSLPDRIRRFLPDLQLVSLGGATEGSIWSILYPIGAVDERWRSIPYGKPLTNQRMHVLDRRWQDCPDGVAGEIHIGGTGVADGYLGDPVRTAERFVEHPRTGERLYRTGDLGRYLPDGNIEFLGRQDNQVKIRGHRIELAEVEAGLVADPRIANAAVVLDDVSRADRRLVAFIEPAARTAQGTSGLAPAVVGAASTAADESTAGVDRAAYAAYLGRLDKLALLCMLQTFQRNGLFQRPQDVHTLSEILVRTQAPARHHRVVRRWVRALADHGLLVREGSDRYRSDLLVEASVIEAGWREVDDLVMRLDPDSAKVHDYFKASTGSLPEVLRSDGADAVQLLFPEGRIDIGESLYNVTLFNRWANAILVAAVARVGRSSAKPFRVLEVGAGVGGTSMDVIPALAELDVEYTFTDLSQFFLNRAKEAFGDFPWVRYATLDIDTDYRPQGFSPNSFDAIILGDVFHATKHVGRTLQALHELLAPGGWLLFAEMTRDHYQIMTSMELLLTDGREDFADMRRGRDQTFVSHDDWLALLGDDLVFAFPSEPDVFTTIGLYVYGSQVKTDRVPLRPQEVIDAVATRLPAAMVPAVIQILDRLPLTANGKVDRDQLRGLIPPSHTLAASEADEPLDELERRIAGLYGEVLNLPAVGRSQGFYQLGGDSLLASQLAGELIEQLPEARPMSFNAVLRMLLEGPSTQELAAQLRDGP